MKKIAVIGLGKMGQGFCLNLKDHHYQVAGCDLNPTAVAEMQQVGIEAYEKLEDLIASFKNQKIVCILSVQAGAVTQKLIEQLAQTLKPNDVVIDAGNAYYEDSLVNAQLLAKHEIAYLDAGTSGGPSGARRGACMMVGGERAVYEKVQPILTDLTIENGCLYTGSVGSGHFTKMVHNGIEYGMMQAIAEGFQILHESPYQFDLKQLTDIAQLWNNGSVIRSWLIELTAQAFSNQPHFEATAGYVDATGEGLWTLITALKQKTPAPVIAASLVARQTSQKDELFANKVLAVLRQLFGGHQVKAKN